MKERRIEEEQRLRGNRAATAFGGARVRVRPVEQREKRMPLDALRHQVNAAFLRVVNRPERIVLREVRVLRGERMPLARLTIQLVGECEQRVAEFLGLQATGGKRGVRRQGAGGSDCW